MLNASSNKKWFVEVENTQVRRNPPLSFKLVFSRQYLDPELTGPSKALTSFLRRSRTYIILKFSRSRPDPDLEPVSPAFVCFLAKKVAARASKRAFHAIEQAEDPDLGATVIQWRYGFDDGTGRRALQ